MLSHLSFLTWILELLHMHQVFQRSHLPSPCCPFFMGSAYQCLWATPPKTDLSFKGVLSRGVVRWRHSFWAAISSGWELKEALCCQRELYLHFSKAVAGASPPFLSLRIAGSTSEWGGPWKMCKDEEAKGFLCHSAHWECHTVSLILLGDQDVKVQ